MATLIQRFNRHMSVPTILTIVDGAIIILGALVFGIGNALYAIIAVFITAKVSDGLLEGLKFAKMAYIISDEYEKIAEEIMTSLDRGVTGLMQQECIQIRKKRCFFVWFLKRKL